MSSPAKNDNDSSKDQAEPIDPAKITVTDPKKKNPIRTGDGKDPVD